ncbi:MAG: trypsin-like peptidase domain-containing protein [Coriobacteriia bacterium]|nr:trypsin-like peptidase domain-containing protein [Coriobacteriia bacterium]
MTDDTRPNEAPDESMRPDNEAAENTIADQAAAAPPSTGPSVATPPVATWQDSAPTAPFPAEQPEAPTPMYAQPPVTSTPSKPGLGAAVFAAILAALVVGALAGFAGGFLGARLAGGSLTSGPSSVTVVPSKTDEPVVAAAAAAVPSVVNIDVTESAASGGTSGLPSTPPTVPLNGNGSGVAFKSANDGGTYILTNNHVVENANTITVRSPLGQSWPGKVVGRDADNDIAVVKITGKLPLIVPADPKTFQVGQTVVAIGSPYGLEHTVTSGVISAIGRSLSDIGSTGASQPLVDTIQTDAAINPGNSGGALVDRQGHLVGINTAIYSQSGSAAGIGFAIPVDTALNIADQIITTGKVTHPFIGIIGSTITPLIATQKKLPVSEGALVEDVVKGAGAATAGVKIGDVVTAVDGTPITSMTDLIGAIRKHTLGQTAELTILRGGQTIKLKVNVSDRPAGVTSTAPATGK